MATPIQMPNVGISVETCILTTWHKKKGDTVKEGETLFTYETDKSTLDEEAKASGTILELFFEEGDEVPIMTNIGVIGNPGESTGEFKPAGEGDAAAAPSAAPVATEKKEEAPAAAVAAPATANQGFLRISPRAKLLAAKSNVDPRFATATGPEERVIERDIRALMANGPTATAAAAAAANLVSMTGTGIGGKISVADLSPAAAASAAVAAGAPAGVPYVDEKLSHMRKVIAKSMLHSLNTMAQLTHTLSFDATNIMAFRKQIKENGVALGLENITLNDIILYAVSRTLMNYRALNANLIDDTMRYFTDVHLGMAVDTDKGLMVPTIFNANKLSLNELARTAKALAADCQKGSIKPDMLSGASFTVSNLGSLDIEHFTPIVNPPQTGILGVNTITQKAKEVNGVIKMYPSMSLSLTYDHRALDGTPASKFLKELKGNLENFSLLLVK